MISKEYKGINGEIKVNKEETHVYHWTELQYGMFIHLGLYSILGGMWEGKPVKEGYSEQIQMWADIPAKDYKAHMENFSLERFDPQEIVSLAKKSGMKYLVITTKHHDGFCLFDTKTTDYNIMNTPFNKDLVKLLAEECKRQGLKFGMYYSLVDWNAGHQYDYNNNNEIPDDIELLITEQLEELMTKYGEICEIWFDMSSPTIEQSKKFKNIVRNYQPNAAINGRIWNNQGDFRTLDDNQIPQVRLEGLWQTPASIYNETWGYREWQKRIEIDKKVSSLLKNLISVRARGGNYLLNIGPKGDGSLVAYEVEVLERMGDYLNRNPQTILETNPTKFNNQSWGEITINRNKMYLHIMEVPKNNIVKLYGLVTKVKDIYINETCEKLKWSQENNCLEIKLPLQSTELKVSTIRVELLEDLYMIPENTSRIANNGLIITEENIEKGYNFVDDGNYTSLRQSNVSLKTYVHVDNVKEVYIEIRGEANPKKDYSIQFGLNTLKIRGSELIGNSIGPFTFSSEQNINELKIHLANADSKYEDIELKVEKIVINKK